VVEFPFCKINLGLAVVSKRQDGFHNLETCFYPVPWTDVLEIILSDKLLFTTSGNEIPGNPVDNLCVKAYELLRRDFDLPPVNIHLHKIIPSGAGLGGGSSDAAHTLKLLNTIFSLKISPSKLMDYAADIGSDCSFFIDGRPMIGTGRGEILKKIDFSLNKFLAIIKPAVHISTRDAFSGITPRPAQMAVEEVILKLPVNEWKDVLSNDFEQTVFNKYPVLRSAKERLYELGATYASMTGSGSALFGIFEREIDLSDEFTDVVHWSGFID
jgi:4-diphosphocytidyl-2-C-methyl-D-erythritol kinase